MPAQHSTVNLESDRGYDVEVNSGDSVVISGIIKNITITTPRKIPLLGDLPVVGFAFRNQGRNQRKSEIIIFLTPQTK